MRVYIPVAGVGRLSRRQSLEVTELLGKAIEGGTAHKVIGTPADADLILEATFRPVVRPQP